MAFDSEMRGKAVAVTKPNPYEKLEALIRVVETLSPLGYDQDMSNNVQYHDEKTNLCAQGHAMRLGLLFGTDKAVAGEVFNLPSMTAARLFGNTAEVNKILGRALRKNIHPKDWAKAARKVIAERKIIDRVS